MERRQGEEQRLERKMLLEQRWDHKYLAARGGRCWPLLVDRGGCQVRRGRFRGRLPRATAGERCRQRLSGAPVIVCIDFIIAGGMYTFRARLLMRAVGNALGHVGEGC